MVDRLSKLVAIFNKLDFRANTRELKSGMMQQLLTGRIRLPVEGTLEGDYG